MAVIAVRLPGNTPRCLPGAGTPQRGVPVMTKTPYVRSVVWVLAAFALYSGGASAQTATADKQGEPPVPFKLALGKQLYQSNCAQCHGAWAAGTTQGPPLIHPFYRPDHHGDPAFYNAGLNGVRAHHWEFGDMPAIAGITRKDLDAIVPFIRWLQQERGLY
jgi:mono/diheme cytochrome c family protein